MKLCSFLCEHSVSGKAQHAACLAVNGVYCRILDEAVEKGRPCPVTPERLKEIKDKEEK